jgi:hypothetical protein
MDSERANKAQPDIGRGWGLYTSGSMTNNAPAIENIEGKAQRRALVGEK